MSVILIVRKFMSAKTQGLLSISTCACRVGKQQRLHMLVCLAHDQKCVFWLSGCSKIQLIVWEAFNPKFVKLYNHASIKQECVKKLISQPHSCPIVVASQKENHLDLLWKRSHNYSTTTGPREMCCAVLWVPRVVVAYIFMHFRHWTRQGNALCDISMPQKGRCCPLAYWEHCMSVLLMVRTLMSAETQTLSPYVRVHAELASNRDCTC